MLFLILEKALDVSPGGETIFALVNCQNACLWEAHWLKKNSDEGFQSRHSPV